MSLRRIAFDLVGVILLMLASVGAGLALNAASSRPISLSYRTPEQRLQAELAQLISTPAFGSSPVSMIGLDEFRADVEGKSALVLDARSSSFYQEGHVPGALNLARDDFGADYLRLRSMLDKSHDKRVVVYCSGGECRDSKMVAQALMTLGFGYVTVFSGGWEEWTAAHLPAERG